jgi:hypothetical protein
MEIIIIWLLIIAFFSSIFGFHSTKIKSMNSEKDLNGFFTFFLLANIFIYQSLNKLFPDTKYWLSLDTISTLMLYFIVLTIMCGAIAFLRRKENSSEVIRLSNNYFMIMFIIFIFTVAGYSLAEAVSDNYKIIVHLGFTGYTGFGLIGSLGYLVNSATESTNNKYIKWYIGIFSVFLILYIITSIN